MSAATPSGNVSQNYPLDLNLLTALANVVGIHYNCMQLDKYTQDHPHATTGTTEQMWTWFQRMAQQHFQAHWAKNIQHLSNDGHSGNSSNNIQQPISSVQSTTETQCIESVTKATN
eukprot:963513_1